MPTVARSAKVGCLRGLRELRVASQPYSHAGLSVLLPLLRCPCPKYLQDSRKVRARIVARRAIGSRLPWPPDSGACSAVSSRGPHGRRVPGWPSQVRPPSATCTHGTKRTQTKRRSLRSSRAIAMVTPGREQPSREPLGVALGRNREGCSRPSPSVTPAKCVSCAAQNAALMVGDRSSKSSVRRDLQKQSPVRLLGSRSISRDDLASRDKANHRVLSRLPSRPQPFAAAHDNPPGRGDSPVQT